MFVVFHFVFFLINAVSNRLTLHDSCVIIYIASVVNNLSGGDTLQKKTKKAKVVLGWGGNNYYYWGR